MTKANWILKALVVRKVQSCTSSEERKGLNFCAWVHKCVVEHHRHI